MTAIVSGELIADLEAAVSGGSPDRRVLMLRRVTHMFLSRAARLNEHQIGVFDDVLLLLIEHIEADSLVQLSSTLADLSAAPKKAVRRLACHDDIAVAAPVLFRSACLSDGDLTEIANEVGGQHLIVICTRRALDDALTDVLLRRGGVDACRALAKNAGARFSESGHAILVATAEINEDIAESLGFRSDLPATTLRELLSKATDEVRFQLLKSAPPKLRQSIRQALDGIAAHVSATATEPVVYSEVRSRIVALNNEGRLNDSTVNRFALRRESTCIIAALSVLSGASMEVIEPLMEEKSCEALIVACRASRLCWPTTLAIIRSRSVPQLSEQELAQAKEKFERLYLSTAQRMIRNGHSIDFGRKQETTGNSLAAAGTNG